MNLLLDTRVLLWALSDDPQLSTEARTAIETGSNLVFVSAATAWEIAIKKSLGKLQAPDNYLGALEYYRFTPLDITSEHALAVEALPHHHSDPFDRLLVAQANHERLTIVTHDCRIALYDANVLMT